MPGALTNIVKGSMLGYCDARMSQRLEQNESVEAYRDRLQDLLKRFQKGQRLLKHANTRSKVGKDLILASTPEQEQHVHDEFFGNKQAVAYFPGLPGNPEEIVRGGYIRALELALAPKPPKPPKPIVSYWILNGRDVKEPGAFEIFVAESDREVHVLLSTPKPARGPYPPEDPKYAPPEDMFVVATAQRIEEISKGYPPSYAPKEIPLKGAAQGVKCLQVIGY